jgi:hypothetical protein
LGPGVGSEVPAGLGSDLGMLSAADGARTSTKETGAGGALSALWGGRGRGVETGILVAVGKEEKGIGVGTGLAVGLGVAEGPGVAGDEAAKNSSTSSTTTATNAAMANAMKRKLRSILSGALGALIAGALSAVVSAQTEVPEPVPPVSCYPDFDHTVLDRRITARGG